LGLFDNFKEKHPECKAPEDWFYKENHLASSGKLNDAVKCFDEAIKLDLKNSQAWNNKGFALKILGQLEESEKCFEKSTSIKLCSR